METQTAAFAPGGGGGASADECPRGAIKPPIEGLVTAVSPIGVRTAAIGTVGDVDFYSVTLAAPATFGWIGSVALTKTPLGALAGF